ncbi:MAG TPA: hypothetical protein DCX27_16085 [Balneola sp.]|nr:hypothetical protein [Balneola sp.]|tara:strand:- start:510 stop:1478 length:969 start_codon:yes stop_codon:yes gene_type:complete
MTTFAPHDTDSRNLGIGTSDASTVMGEGFRSRIQLWEEKTGKTEKTDFFSEKAFWGTELEETILRNIPKLMQVRGFEFDNHKIRKDGKTYWNKELQINNNPFIYGHLDGRIGLEVAEIKFQSGFSYKDWEKFYVPKYYYWQGICALAVVPNAPSWRIYSLCNGEIVWRTLHREEVQDDIDSFLSKAEEFWRKNVLEGVMPDPETEEDLIRAYEEENLKTVVMKPHIEAKLDEAERLKNQAELTLNRSKKLKFQAKLALGDADEVIDEDGTVLYTYRYVKPKVTLDSKKVKELYPDVYEECTKVGEPSRRFVNKRKSEPEFKI